VRVPSSWPPAVRLTRRGRIVVAVMTTLALAALALVLASSVDAAPAQIDHAATVSAGQTLSEVAAVQLPRLPVRDAVAQIQLANSLSSSQVHAGQILLIPAIP
jgi:LysM repeat protein